MNLRDPKLVDALAKAYVLGTLRGPARDRFESQLPGNLPLRRAVSVWEERLVPLALSAEPIAPPETTWAAIEQRTGLAAPRSSAGFWPALAASFAAAAIVFGMLFFTAPTPEPSPDYVVVLQDEAQSPQWLLEGFAEDGEALLTAVNIGPAPSDRDYELWMLPDDGSAPVSLGLLVEAGSTRLALSAAQQSVLAGTSTLAVSLEPTGGSTTGAPTGPVLFTGAVIRT